MSQLAEISQREQEVRSYSHIPVIEGWQLVVALRVQIQKLIGTRGERSFFSTVPISIWETNFSQRPKSVFRR